MCYETVVTMLTYGNWCYAEDPLAKRRKTSKSDSGKTKELTNQTIDVNDMMRSNKPLLAVRNLVGDRLSAPKNRSGSSIQGGHFFSNVGREANNPYYVQGYPMQDPALMYGVRGVRNVWPGRMQIPNAPPRYEYRPTTIARPFPLRARPVLNSFRIQNSHAGWVRASVRSAFTPVRKTYPERQTSIVTTQSVATRHSSSIQSLSQMVSSVSTSSTEALSANCASIPVQITSESSQSQACKPTAQPIATAPPSANQPHESPKFLPSHIPVQTIMYSPSLRTASQTVCSITTTVTDSLPEDLSVSTARMRSTGSSTSQTSVVTAQPIMASHSSPNQSPSLMVGSVTAISRTPSPEDLSVKRPISTTGITSSGPSQSQDFKPTAQPTTSPPSFVQAQEPPKFQPSHIPVQTIMYSPASSIRATKQSFCTTTTAVTTSSYGEHAANSVFSTARIISPVSPVSQTSIVTTQPIMTTHSSSNQVQEAPKFQPSHIPVQTIMYSPSLRAANQSSCSVITNTTTTVTTSSAEELSSNSTFTTSRIVLSGSSQTQVSKPTAQTITTAPPSFLQTQEVPKIQPSHIPVQTIVYSPALRAKSQTACSVTTDVTTSSDEKLFSANSAFSSTQIVSTGLSTCQTFVDIEHSSPMQSPSSVVDSGTDSMAEDLSIRSAFSTARIMSSGSSQFQDSQFTTQPIMTAPPSPLQPEDLSKPKRYEPEVITISPPSSPLVEELSPFSLFPTQSIATVPPSSIQSPVSSNSQTSKRTTHLVLLSPSPSLQSPTSQTTAQSTSFPPSPSLQSSESAKIQTPKITTHLLLLSPPTSAQSSKSSNSQPTAQPMASPPSVQSSETTTQASKLTTHLLLLSPTKSVQPSEPSPSQNAPLTKLLLISPPISQIVCTATTPTTPSPTVVSSNIGGESSSEAALDVDETAVDATKDDIPSTSKDPTKRKEDEIEEKDALLQRMYSVPAFGGKTVKGVEFFERMLTKPKLCHLFKCMASDCSFTSNQKTSFDKHIKMHEAQLGIGKEISKSSTEEDDESYDWQQCAYCCDSPTYPATSLSEHLITEHGYCVYQCAYCFYRALFQNYVDIHQTLAHRKILRDYPRVIYKCKAFSEGPTIENALKKTGRRRCVRPYHCDQCGSEFLITEEFMNHLLKKHQSVTSYTCHICKNVCFKPDRLVVHYKLHSYSTYQCPYCLHGTETERKMIFHLCTFHFAQPACLYVRAWGEGKQVQSEDKSKKLKSKTRCTDQLDSLKMIAYDIEAIAGESTLEDASDEDSGDEERLIIDESQELNDIIAELGITTETEPIHLMQELASIGMSTSQNVSVSDLLPNARFSLESETGAETVLISSGLSSNSSSN